MSDKELTLKDFAFLNEQKVHKIEFRYNENTSKKVMIRAAFKIDDNRKDTLVQFESWGKNHEDVMTQLYLWYKGYFNNIRIFDQLTEGGTKADTN